MRWVGGCGSGSAGLIARELNSGSSAAVGVVCDSAGALRLAFWQDTLNLVWQSPFALAKPNRSAPVEVYLKLDVDLVRAQAWWSPTGEQGTWAALAGDGRTEGIWAYTSTRLVWAYHHAGPGFQQYPSRGVPYKAMLYGGDISTANEFGQSNPFSTQHPGLFAGGGSHAKNLAEFDYWRYTDHERDAQDMA